MRSTRIATSSLRSSKVADGPTEREAQKPNNSDGDDQVVKPWEVLALSPHLLSVQSVQGQVQWYTSYCPSLSLLSPLLPSLVVLVASSPIPVHLLLFFGLPFPSPRSSTISTDLLDGLLKGLDFTQKKADSQVRWAVLNTILFLCRYEQAIAKLSFESSVHIEPYVKTTN